MVFFVSLQKLLFTHKPLDTSDKGVQVQSYQNLISEGFEILQTRIITGFADFFNLFPLRFERIVIHSKRYQILDFMALCLNSLSQKQAEKLFCVLAVYLKIRYLTQLTGCKKEVFSS